MERKQIFISSVQREFAHTRDKLASFINNSEYQSVFSVAKRTASQDLNQLLSLDLVSREGTTGKGVFYRLSKGASKGHKGHDFLDALTTKRDKMGTKKTPSQPDTEEKEMTHSRIDPRMTQTTQLLSDERKPGMAHKRPKWLIRCAPELRHRLKSTDNRPIFQPKSSDWARGQSSGLRQVPGRQSSSRGLGPIADNGRKENPFGQASGLGVQMPQRPAASADKALRACPPTCPVRLELVETAKLGERRRNLSAVLSGEASAKTEASAKVEILEKIGV
ncbi:MAG: hypothetical protein ACFE0O_14245 [Opitutales bacterium]